MFSLYIVHEAIKLCCVSVCVVLCCYQVELSGTSCRAPCAIEFGCTNSYKGLCMRARNSCGVCVF